MQCSEWWCETFT